MTSLVGGKRVRKDCTRLEAYGTVDELSSNLGLLMSVLSDETAIKRITECQNVLFCVGAVLATEQEECEKRMTGVKPEDVATLEHQMDEWNASLPGWRGFVLPGGVESAARAHVCRTVCRRAERLISALAEKMEINTIAIAFINRLSDFLFVYARYLNKKEGVDEIYWSSDSD